MLNSKNVLKQIKQLTTDVIQSGLCDAQNFPLIIQRSGGITEVGISSTENSIFLKNILYAEMYTELLNKKHYNLKMIDGALITLLYRFQKEELIAHRLSFFPAPNLEVFQNEPELYMQDELYLEFLDKRIVTVPLRFDFDSGDAFVPIDHPKSHLTLGQYKNCRIPVSSAISPYQFITFIMRNFYRTAQDITACNLTSFLDKFPLTIVPEEKTIVHVCTPI